MTTDLKIDGAHGEGGGQILRSSLALAALTGKSIAIENIRARRKNPGLQRQHLCAVRAAKEICDGELEGDEIGSGSLCFHPGSIRSGEYRFDIGTAGSCSLVAQTVLLPLLFASAQSKVVIQGGTHNPMAPPFEFLSEVFSQQVRKMGIDLQFELVRHGFYPQGGGQIEFEVQPIECMLPIKLCRRMGRPRVEVNAYVSNLPRHIAEREVSVISRRSKIPIHDARVTELDVGSSFSKANYVVIKIIHENCAELILELGQVGVRAEQVAAKALRQAQGYLNSTAPVGEYLADQIVFPAAIAADRFGQPTEFVTHVLSDHLTTHLWLLQQFLEVEIVIEESDEGSHRILISPAHGSNRNHSSIGSNSR